MLNLNVSNTQNPTQTWKVLIFDKLGQNIISPLLKVNELRDNGITIHMSINADRQPIPDVPAVYFIDPTGQNIEKLKQVHFTTTHIKKQSRIFKRICTKRITSIFASLFQELCWRNSHLM